MQDLNDLYYFVQVVDHGGFAPAGRALDEPKSKLSRRLAALEERLGVRLLQRSTRRFSVTETGQIYYQHCKAVLVEAEAAQSAIDALRVEPRGTVRIACPLTLLDAYVNDMLVDYMAQYPEVTVVLEASNRRVDVIAEGFDIALRVRLPPLEDSDLALRVLGTSGQCLVASPKLLSGRAPPASLADLQSFPSLALGRAQIDHVWHLFGPGAAETLVRHSPRLVTGGMTSLLAAARAGLGIVQLPQMLTRDDFNEGHLVKVLPDWAPKSMLAHAVFPSRRGLVPSVRRLIDHLAQRYGELVDP